MARQKRGSVLQSRREALGWTRDYLAEKMGVTVEQVEKLETSKRPNRKLGDVMELQLDNGEWETKWERAYRDRDDFVRKVARSTAPGNAELIAEGERLLAVFEDDTDYRLNAGLAKLYRLEKQYEKALWYAELVRNFHLDGFDHTEIETLVLMARAQYEFAMIDHELGYYLSALNHLKITLDTLKRILTPRHGKVRGYQEFEFAECEMITLRAKSLVMAGVVAAQLGRHREADKYAVDAMSYAVASNLANKSWFVARCFYIRGQAAYSQGNFNSAAGMFRRAHDEFSKLNDMYSVQQMQHNVADSLLKAGNLYEALNAASSIVDGFASPTDKAKAACLSAEILLAQKRYDDAIKAAESVHTFDGACVTTRAEANLVEARARMGQGDSEGWEACIANAFQLLRDAADESPAIMKMKMDVTTEYLRYPRD